MERKLFKREKLRRGGVESEDLEFLFETNYFKFFWGKNLMQMTRNWDLGRKVPQKIANDGMWLFLAFFKSIFSSNLKKFLLERRDYIIFFIGL